MHDTIHTRYSLPFPLLVVHLLFSQTFKLVLHSYYSTWQDLSGMATQQEQQQQRGSNWQGRKISALTLTVPNPPILIRFCTHSRGLGLINIWGDEEYHHVNDDPFTKKKKIMERISTRLGELGYKRSVTHITNKLKQLKTKYKQVQAKWEGTDGVGFFSTRLMPF